MFWHALSDNISDGFISNVDINVGTCNTLICYIGPLSRCNYNI